MDPLGPSTSTLFPAISHIAETASSLADMGDESSKAEDSAQLSRLDESEAKQIKQRQAASWIVETPRRFKGLLKAGKRDEVIQEWADIQLILDKWASRGVQGVDLVKTEVITVLEDNSKH